MADKSSIEWTDATWNPIRGCSRVSEGCRHCYAEGVAARFSGPGLPYEGLAKRVTRQDGSSEARWTGKVAFSGDDVLTQPLRWKKPRKIFVNSMSDLFHENVPDEWIDRIFAVMALAPQHVFQVLTKRPERMRAYMADPATPDRVDKAMDAIAPPHWHDRELQDHGGWPLSNVWLGTSVEDQVTADTRLPYLRQTPAAMRFISFEPLLGPVQADLAGVGWAIVGGESGAGARPMHPDWARALRDQCAAAGVPFFFKQWGEWAPAASALDWHDEAITVLPDGRVREWHPDFPASRLTSPHMCPMIRVGKHRAGRLLDGVEHNGFPATAGDAAHA